MKTTLKQCEDAQRVLIEILGDVRAAFDREQAFLRAGFDKYPEAELPVVRRLSLIVLTALQREEKPILETLERLRFKAEYLSRTEQKGSTP